MCCAGKGGSVGAASERTGRTAAGRGAVSEALRAEFETFLQVVAGDRESPCTVADGLEADWIAEACARSAREHRPVRIEEVRTA
jgi:predicted dehydrogenase